jgi:hypothetical protein
MARPLKEINWDVVEKKMEAGCSAKEISANLCDLDTFYRRFKEKYGMSFADYTDDFYSVGDGLIKFTQYMKAISGNIPMLQLLGKERLGQGKDQERVPDNDEQKSLEHENTLLRYENKKLKEINARQPQAGTEFCRSDTSFQHMGGSGPIGKDLR